MNEIHIGHVLFNLVVFELAVIPLISAILLAKWTRWYWSSGPFRAFKSAIRVVFGSEVRVFEFLSLFIAFNSVGFSLFVLYMIVSLLRIHISW
jgi:hypothetical protein